MGPLFPRLHVNDAAKGGGPRAPPRNKMALYEQFTVPSHRFSGGGSLAHSTSAASQNKGYGCDRPLFEPFNVPSNGPGHSAEKMNSHSINRQINGSRKDSGMLSSQRKGLDKYGSGSRAECTPQQRCQISPIFY
ncbi:hypothetical protein E2562_023148 [Oryza meyeriana var. granulata]|uniref:Uncharacterized protein n=1 Tax=Oryza meyeriana var. granulata TaxID=110450 RepID=A0A6G1E1E3_9ORYZ|nr:hypothetical protein E2562_023148 [Oryza meyeriana var. granulata]